MRVILFDDATAADWMPFTLTRPAGELLFGAFTPRARAERLFGSCAGHIASPELLGFEEPSAAPVLDGDAIDAAEPTLFLSSRAIIVGRADFDPTRSGAVRVGGVMAGCFVSNGATPPAEFLASPRDYAITTEPDGTARFDPGVPADAPAYDLPGRVLENVWELITLNAEQLIGDLESPALNDESAKPSLPVGVHCIGGRPDRVQLVGDVDIEPGVVLDVSTGPIRFEDGVTVRALSRVQGPTFVGRGTTLLGGSYTAVSIGPHCKIHGEIEETVVLGCSNKAHDGYIGHAYVGRWVNLGALTTNSDLKNNYGAIRLWTPRGDVDTGQIKIGCLLGDHVKTGIGVMLNTGTIVGAGCNLFGAVQPPKYVAPFSWGSGADFVEYDMDKFLETAEAVMQRRNVVLSEGQSEVLRRAWAGSRSKAGGARSESAAPKSQRQPAMQPGPHAS